MRNTLIAVLALSCLPASIALARGVSPYLPVGINPEMERKIERVLLLADKPMLTRPIAAATVLDALPAACSKDPETCLEVRGYLRRFMGQLGITDMSLEVAASSGSEHTIPNRYGLTTDSPWAAAARGYYQPFDHALVSLGAVAYEGEVNPEGSMLSLGWNRAQLDIGYRPHWLSPFSDSSMLIGTEAATMPSVTLSNYAPLTRFGFQYELFIARMSSSDLISYGETTTSGHPRLAGIHLASEPAAGWSLGVNRLMQYGGGERPGSLSDLAQAFFNPNRYDNTAGATDEQFGNQVASITSTMIFPWRVPFSVYFEYAGEDTSNGKNYLLGNAALSAGLRMPQLWRRFDLTVELSEWQNGWYVNGVYGDGLTNKRHVIGHWGGDNRKFGAGNDVGARSAMVRLGWSPGFGGAFEARARALKNEEYFGTPYETAYDGTVSYSRPFGYITVGAEIQAGRDVFGDSFSRAAAFFRLNELHGADAANSLVGDDPSPWPVDKTAEVFLEAGAAMSQVKADIVPEEPLTKTSVAGVHLSVGARRAVSDRSDLGARFELDDVDGHTLLSVRAIDYRYRFANPLALNVFIGASRYDLATPAYGLYFGAGLQWRDLLPGWDLGLDARQAKKVARDHVLASDPQSPVRPDSFYTINSLSLSMSKRF